MDDIVPSTRACICRKRHLVWLPCIDSTFAEFAFADLNLRRNVIATGKSATAAFSRLLGFRINPCKPFRPQSLGFCESGEPVYFVVHKSLLSGLLPTQLRSGGCSASYFAVTI
jgi:hypothetical protein